MGKTGGGKGTNQYAVKGVSDAARAREAADGSPSLAGVSVCATISDSDPLAAGAAPAPADARQRYAQAALASISEALNIAEDAGDKGQLAAARKAVDAARFDAAAAAVEARHLQPKSDPEGWEVDEADALRGLPVGGGAPMAPEKRSAHRAAILYLRAAAENLREQPDASPSEKVNAIARARRQLSSANLELAAAAASTN